MPHIEETLQRTAKILKCDLIDLDSDFGRERLMTVGSTAVGQRWLRIPVRYILIRTIEDHLQMLPGELRAEYLEAITNASDSFLGKYEREILATWPGETEPESPETPDEDAKRQGPLRENKVLTEITPERNVAGMTEIALLLQRLKRALEGVRKGDLARSLKVPLPRVSEWLSGRVMPSGETALRLLHWVEQREQKLNAPGGAINTTKGKTQLRSSKAYEKTKSNPRKG